MKQRKTLTKLTFVLVYLGVAAGCVLLDQLTKLLIFDGLLQSTPGKSVNILGSFLRFYALYNEGAAFGIGQEEGANIIFFIITVLGLPLFCYLLWRSRTRSVCGQVGFAFIVGGTIGNAIDRGFVQSEAGKFFSGKVRDFISFSIFPPVFNVADSFLVIGVFMAILAIVVFDSDGLVATFKQELAEKAAAEAAKQLAEEALSEEPAEEAPTENPAQEQEPAETENTDEEN